MVKLRSGKCVDLGVITKSRSCCATSTKAIMPPKHQTRAEMKTSLEFEIYEDDPDTVRPDLEAPPLQCWDMAAVDQENLEPLEHASTQEHPSSAMIPSILDGYRFQSNASTVRSGSLARPVLHQIAQDDDPGTSQPYQSTENASRCGKKAQISTAQKSARSSMTPSAQISSTKILNTKPAQSGDRRVSLLGLR